MEPLCKGDPLLAHLHSWAPGDNADFHVKDFRRRQDAGHTDGLSVAKAAGMLLISNKSIYSESMYSPSHLIVNLALLWRKTGGKAAAWAIAAGAILPDLPMMVMFGWERFINRVPGRVIFDQLYYEPPWQIVTDAFNSIPLILLGWALAIFFRSSVAQLIFMSMLAHIVFDIPVHTIDAHNHLFPLSAERFISTLSYWDRAHHAGWVVAGELVLVALSAVTLWRRGISRAGQIALIGLGLLYVAAHAIPLVVL